MMGDNANHLAGHSRDHRRGPASPLLMELRLATFGARVGFVGVVLAIGASLTFLGEKEAVLEHLGNSASALSLEKAIDLDPGNAGLHYRLGTVYILSTEEHDLSKAFIHLRRATELNPHHGRYWLRLAAAAESMGDTSRARAAMEQALKLRPMSPEFWWAAGNYYLRAGETESAWEHFRHLLRLSPDHSEAVFRLCYLAAREPGLVYTKIITSRASPPLKLSYIDFLSRQGEDEGAFQIWQQTAARATPRSFEFSRAQPYIERLLALNRTEEARAVWNDLARLEIIPQLPTAETRNAVFNGDFEESPLNAGFDWRTSRLPYVAINPKAPEYFQGAHGLRVDFTVKHNDGYELLYQLVPVSPRCEYRLEAQVRSEGITSDSGPRLRVLDIASPGDLDLSTRPVLGTTAWHPIGLEFTTGPATRLIRLAVWRPRSRTYPTEISGSFWMDAVSLRRVGDAGRQAAAQPPPLP